MLARGLIISCLALSMGLARAADDPTGSLPGVVDLTPDNFDKIVNGGKHVLAEFYAPWCGHCKHLVPAFKELGPKVLADPRLASRVVVAKCNADEHRSIGERYGITGFPTLKFFSRGEPTSKPMNYNGGRTADDFFAYLTKRVEEDRGFARIPALDSLAKLFVSADDRQKALDSLTEGVSGITDTTQTKAAELYGKYAKKSVDKGVEYFEKEIARLERMLDSGSVGSGKVGEITQKLSVLSAFVPEKVKEAAEKATKAAKEAISAEE